MQYTTVLMGGARGDRYRAASGRQKGYSCQSKATPPVSLPAQELSNVEPQGVVGQMFNDLNSKAVKTFQLPLPQILRLSLLHLPLGMCPTPKPANGQCSAAGVQIAHALTWK